MRTWLHTNDPIDSATSDDTALPQSSAPASDSEEPLQALQSMMGREWVARGLSDLIEQLEATFGHTDPHTVNRSILAQQAHMLVSRAGILGFSELSQLCSALEQTSKSEQPLSDIFETTKMAARHAQAQSTSFLRRMEAHSPGASRE